MSAFIRRLFSFSLVQLVIEVAVFAIFIALESPIFATLHIPLLEAYGASFTGSTLSVLIPLGILIAGARFLEHRSLAEVGLPWRRTGRDLLLGFVITGAAFSAIMGIMALFGWYQVTGVVAGKDIPGILLSLGWLFFGAAVLEEVVFRGIIFRLLERAAGSWIAVGLSAIFFGASHLANPNATLEGALAIAITAGLVAALVYMLTRSLWLLIGFHWAWNFFEATIFGNATSGRTVTSILHSRLTGPVLWTGGAFGPEAGLLVIIMGLLIAIPLLWFIVRDKKYLTPRWMPTANHIKTVQAEVAQ
jgi:membrane protease YdiL (CAAX protease family)